MAVLPQALRQVRDTPPPVLCVAARWVGQAESWLYDSLSRPQQANASVAKPSPASQSAPVPTQRPESSVPAPAPVPDTIGELDRVQFKQGGSR